MDTRQVRELVPSLTRQELYRYEARGYIKPKKRVSGKVKRRDYSDQEVELIKLIKYYDMTGSSEGRSLEKAYHMAIEDMGKSVEDVLRRY